MGSSSMEVYARAVLKSVQNVNRSTNVQIAVMAMILKTVDASVGED